MFESHANASVAYRVRFDDEVLVFPHNQTDAGAYNFTTGRYVCPEDGKYELTVMVAQNFTSKARTFRVHVSHVRLIEKLKYCIIWGIHFYRPLRVL